MRINTGPDSKNVFRQVAEMFWLAARYRFSPIEYRTYRFFDRDKTFTEISTYLSNHELTYKIRSRLYDPRVISMLNNKLIFNRYYSSFNLPLPRLYGLYLPGAGFTADQYPLREADDLRAWLGRSKVKEFFVKPCGGKKGSGVIIIRDVSPSGKGNYVLLDASGYRWNDEELAEHMGQQSGHSNYPGYLLEEKITQHQLLSEINPTSVNTCRILTLALPNNTVAIPYAVFRFGRAGVTVDSWSQGGIAFRIDPDQGKMSKGVFHPDWGSTKEISCHPDSGVKVEGMAVPRWDEVKNLVRKAASLTPGIKSIGWDVAITNEKAVLVEGNSLWSPLIFQGISGGFITPQNRELFKQYNISLR